MTITISGVRNEDAQQYENEVDNLSVSVQYLRIMAQELGARGKQLKQLLQGTGITLKQFLHDDFKLTHEQLTIFGQNSFEMTQEEDLGLRIGRRFTPETHGSIGFLVSSSPNVKVALTNLIRYFPLIFPFIELQMTNVRETTVITFKNTHPVDDKMLDRTMIECWVQSICAVIESITSTPLIEAQLRLSYDPPSYVSRYKDYFSFPFTFSSSESRLSISQRVALAANPKASKVNYALALDQCNAMIQRIPKQNRLTSERVKSVLLSSPPGAVSGEIAARRLFMSERTLYRQLRNEGTSFRKLRDNISAEIASQLLLQTDDSVESIALLLNYSDASNFRRAFKKWCKHTPETFRQQGVKGQQGNTSNA